RGIRANVNDRSAAGLELDPVAVAPNTGIHAEIATVKALSLWVVPKAERHGRQRLREHQLPHLIDERPSRVVPRLDLGAQAAALNLSGANRQEWTRQHERGAHVGAPADGAEQHVRRDVVIYPAEAVAG